MKTIGLGIIFLLCGPLTTWATKINDAIINGDIELLETHIKNGEDVEYPDEYGQTGLHVAVVYKQSQAIPFLIDAVKGNKIDYINSADSHGYTALYYASKLGRIQAATILISNGADINVQREGGGQTPLITATLSNQIAFANFIIEQGADVNITDKNKNIALHHAISTRGNEKFVLILNLVKKESNIDAINFKGDTPLDVANFYGDTRSISILKRGLKQAKANNNSGIISRLTGFFVKSVDGTLTSIKSKCSQAFQ